MRILDITSPKFLGPMFETGTSIILKGPPGVGKSSIVRHDFVRILSEYTGETFGFHEEMSTTLDAPDLRGFLVPGKDKDGKAVSYFTRPGVMPSADYLRAHPFGVYFIDERGQSGQLVQNGWCPTVLDKEIGNEKLPPGWWVISASNRMEDRAAVVRTPMQLVNREREINLHFDITSSAVHWESIGMHPMGIAYAKAKPGIFVNEVPKDPKPYCTPRSYTETWKLLANFAGTDADGHPNMVVPSSTLIQELVAGDIGEATASELFAYLKVADQLPTIEQVLRDPLGCKVPERLDAGYAAVQMCIHHATPANIDKLWTFIERGPIELQTSACKSFIERSGGALLNSPALGKWIAKNRALVISTTRE